MRYPQDQAVDKETSIQLKVNTVSSAKEYIYQYSSDANMSNATTKSHDYLSSFSYASVNKLDLNKTYYWRVKAKNSTDSSDWSSVWSFTTNDSIMYYQPYKNGLKLSPGAQFMWYRVPGYDSFEFQYDTLSTFNSSHKGSVNVRDTFSDFYVSYPLKSMHFGKTYYCRFRGLNSSGQSGWSETRYGTVYDSLYQRYPAQGVARQGADVTFQWTGGGYEKYQLQIDSSLNFNSSLLIDTLGTDRIYHNLVVGSHHYNTTYYWRIRAITSYDTTDWTPRTGSRWFATNSYDLRTAIAYNNSSPTAEVKAPDEIKGSTGNIFHIDTTDQFNSGLFTEIDSPGRSAWVNELLFGTDYFVRVKPYHSTDTGNWSRTRKFNTVRVISTYYPYRGWENIGLEDSLVWHNGHEGVTGYQLQLSETPNFGGSLLVDSSMVNSSVSTYRYFKGLKLRYNQDYYWRMRMWHAKDTSDWDYPTGKKFTTITKPTLLNPYSSDYFKRDVIHTLEWEAVKGATKYQILIDTSEGFNSTALTVLSTDTTILDVNDLYFGQLYRWKVRGLNQNDTTGWSDTWFINTTDKIRLDRPKKNDTTVSRYLQNFGWSSITGTTGYIVELDTSSSFTDPTVFADTSKNPFFHYFHTPAPLEYKGTYYWRVKVYHDLDTTIWSETWSFTVERRIAPYLTYPADSAINIPLGMSYQWEVSKDATTYLLMYADNPNFISAQQMTVVGTSRAVALKPNTTYYWNVRSKNASGQWIGDWSEIWMFKTASSMAITSISSLLAVPSCTV